jgi:hypothetical protein
MKPSYLMLIFLLSFASTGISQKRQTKIINSPIILTEDTLGTIDSLVITSGENVNTIKYLFVTLNALVDSKKFKKIRKSSKTKYGPDILIKLNYDIPLPNNSNLRKSNYQHFQLSSLYLEESAKISNKSMYIALIGYPVAIGSSFLNPYAGVAIGSVIATTQIILFFKSNRLKKKAALELRKIS